MPWRNPTAELISDLSPDAKSLEGYLFPNTYEFTRTQSMKDIAAVDGQAVSPGGGADWTDHGSPTA